jgi:hypothetical protein
VILPLTQPIIVSRLQVDCNTGIEQRCEAHINVAGS